ncbi:acyltransferase family protein [Serratia ureilytica]|uniref:Acyltransferase n=1 Tax=Serratia ureilytica TaxID=300181 RepID=A0A9X9G0I9_9GAMM|nr:acyltransferase [Serratia ureilytica]TXE22860.1 acyltransferase [Serratia ureilytica]
MVSVQWLRALAVMMVVVYHVLLKAQLLGLTSTSFSLGAAGVDLFFIISGFIMVYITFGKSYRPSDFLKKRVIRIVPLYWILTLVAAVVFILQPSLVNSHNGETTIVGSFTLFPVSGKVMLLAVAWTLQYEFLFYFIFSIFLPFINKRYLLVSLSIASLTLLGIKAHDNYIISFFSNPIILEFIYGMAAFFILRKTKLNPLAYIILGVLAFYAFHSFNIGLQQRYIGYGVPMLLIFLGVASIKNDNRVIKLKPFKLLSYIGDASYSIYLTHIFSISITVLLLRKTNLLSTPLLFVALSLTLSLLAGVMSYEIVEKRLRFGIKSKTLNQGA